MNSYNAKNGKTAAFEDNCYTQDGTIIVENSNDSDESYKKSLSTLQSSEIEDIANNIQAAIIRCDFDNELTITYANDGLFRMIGYSRSQFETIHHNSLCAIIHPSDYEKVRDTLCNNLIIGTVTNQIIRLVCENGNFIWTLTRGVVVANSKGSTEFHGVLTDITVQKKTEETLLVNDRSYEIALGFSDITTFGYDVQTKRILTTDIDNTMFGLPGVFQHGVEEFIATGVISPKSHTAIRNLYTEIDEGKPSARAVVYATALNGEERTIELQLINAFDQDGKPTHAIGIRRDITDVIQLEREKDYGSTMVSNKLLIYEANISRDKMIYSNKQWAEEFRVSSITSFSKLVKFLAQNIIASEHRALFEEKSSPQSLTSAFENGEKMVSFEYRKKLRNNEFHWFKKTINIIKDKLTEDIIVRSYIADINDKKVRELIALDEQRLYETMRSKATFIYEFNFTQNILISGHEKWNVLFGIEQTDNYSDMMQLLCDKALHPDDKNGFINNFLRKNVLDSYQSGKNQLAYEYRRPGDTGEYIWVRCTLHLFEDPLTGDVKGYSYIEDINDEKKRELALIYRAEHDLLTGFYNKATTERLITEFLASSNGKIGKHAFLIIDIDYFKSINDNFGHSFGDAVLSQVASKIDDLFREIDILGRIGGDEFVVFMKNIQNTDSTLSKCQDICDKITTSYTKDGVVYGVSASIGIAFYTQHGKLYEELYKNSDSALYIAKESGRNQYKVYSKNMYVATSSVNAINQSLYLEPAAFNTHITQYVFRILYESQDKKSAINSVLELVGKYYSLSRAYVFEYDSVDGTPQNTFEWCDDGIKSYSEGEHNMPYLTTENYTDFFNSDGITIIKDVGNASFSIKKILHSYNIKSQLMFSIIKNGKFVGYIGYDECSVVRTLTKSEMSNLQSVSNILGVFVTEMRSIEANNIAKKVAVSIINGLDSYAYVCNPSTFEIVFANEKTVELSPNATVGSYCYRAIWNKNEPCENCPMLLMVMHDKQKFSSRMDNQGFSMEIRSTASWIDWVDSKKMCLIDSIDIT